MCIRDRVMNAMVTGVVTIVKELPQKIWNSIVAVSYTHLDVYKRQRQRREGSSCRRVTGL